MIRSLITVTLVAACLALPEKGMAGGKFEGVWHPFSRPVEWLGAMTVSRDALSFAAGPEARLDPVREGGSVFRILDPQGYAFGGCGAEPIAYVGFHVLENGQLARLFYWDIGPPAEPTGSNSTQVTMNGACSVMFYAR